jgi:GxxExxY protein
MQRSLVYPDESYRIMGAAFEVYKELGPGFLEAVYREALLIELRSREIPYQSPKPLKILYKGRPLEKFYEADVVCFGIIILELKAVSSLENAHEAQLHNYLKATGFKLGILLNFGHYPLLEHKRIAM